MLRHTTDTIFPFEVNQSSGMKQCRQLPSSDIVSDFKLPKGVSQAIIGVSLSEPHTSGTPLSMCVYLAS